MTKIKIFTSDDPDKLEQETNAFLVSPECYNLDNIEFSTSSFVFLDSSSSMVYSALIRYRPKP